MKRLTLLLAIFFCFCRMNAQDSITGRYARFLIPTEKYVAYRTAVAPKIDGILSDKEWRNAPWTNLFTDISGDGHPAPRFETRAKILWDDDYLYVAAQLEEPDVWAYIKERDEIIYYDNDFEIFLDPDNDGKNYFEMEFNAIATIFDLFIEHPYRSPEKSFITIGWNANGLKVATHIDGTLNDNRDRDRGWTIEVAIPRKSVNDGITNILQAGNVISVGFSRVEWQTDKLADGGYSVRKNKKGRNLPEDNWTWGATGRVAMHMPERWGKVYLSPKESGDVFPAFPDEELMRILWAMFYREEEEFAHNHHYISEIPLTAEERLMTDGTDIRIETTTNTYEIIAKKPDGEVITLNQNGVVVRHKNTLPAIKAYGWYGWDENKVSEDSLLNLFREWKKHGLYGVCVNNGFDYERITRCAAIAFDAGLEYHAWAPSIIHGGLDSTCYTVNRLGKSAFTPEERAYVGYYQTLDPHNPEVVRFLTDAYLKMTAIPYVDYIQLDYIRYADVILAEGLWAKYDHKIHHRWRDENGNVREYPGADYCYCDTCCADFLNKTGIDIRKEIAAGVDPASIPEWAQFRCDVLTDLVNTICDSLHAQGYKVSADVFPGPEGYAEPMVRQQWKKWNVDMLFPMNYNDFYLEDAEWVGEITKQETTGTLKPVASGLFICHDWRNKDKITDPEGSGLTPSELKTAIEGSMSSGAAGICLFTPDRMTEEHWEVFEKVVKGGVGK